MQTSKILFRIVTLTLAATLITACSKEARKTRFLAEADTYFKAGNYDKAKVSYLNVLRLDPQNALAFERIGAMWLEGGSPLRAAAFLAKASELDSEERSKSNTARPLLCGHRTVRRRKKRSAQSARANSGQWRCHYRFD